MTPDDVGEDLADVLGLVERRDNGADGVRPDLVPALDQLHELADDCASRRDADVVALDRQLVPAQAERAVQPVTQRVQHAVADARELGGDLVRDREDFLHAGQCRRAGRQARRAFRDGSFE